MFFGSSASTSTRSKRQPLLTSNEDNENNSLTAVNDHDEEEASMLRRQTYADQVFEDEVNQQTECGEIDDEAEEPLEPAFNDETKRKMTPAGAVFTLMASMLGGAMLTLPFATAKVGIGLSLLISLLSALASETTYFFLVEASRDTKSNTYHSIGKVYLGQGGKIVSMLSLVGLTLFASMGYLLLLGLLVGEMVHNGDAAPSRKLKNLISVIFAVMLAPLSSSRSLYALRYSNMMSVLSAVLLLASVLWESARNGDGFYPSKRAMDEDIKWYTTDLDDIVYAVPFFIGAYMAHFSMLTVHAELVRPTRKRVRGVIRVTLLSAWLLYSVIGVLGYMYALDKTCDSIFSNLPKDVLTIFGRLGLVATLAFSYPLFIVPCRGTLKDLYLSWKGLDESFDTESGRAKDEFESWFATDSVRRTVTVAIVTVSASLACIVPSVALFVSLVGATVGTVLAFLLPALFYLRMSPQRKKSWLYSVLSAVYICFAGFVMVVGTWTSLSHATDDPCDEQK